MTDALTVLGERHTLQVVRELFYGYRRFSDLATLTGAPRSLLTNRLRRLEDAGVVERRQYSEHPPRHEYQLTPAGLDLMPVVLALKEWGERHATDGDPIAVFRHSCGVDLHPTTVCSACRDEVRPGSFEVAGGTEPPIFAPDPLARRSTRKTRRRITCTVPATGGHFRRRSDDHDHFRPERDRG